MTAEPKFVPEEAVEISPDGTTTLSVRLIDSVGYMVNGAVGAMEDGVPRMVTTPWFDYEVPMTEAAEIGTKKVMEEHCSIGIVITTDGTITDIPRTDYIAAEERAIRDMQATGKPFVVLVNSSNPTGSEARILRDYIEDTYGVGEGMASGDDIHAHVRDPERNAHQPDQERPVCYSFFCAKRIKDVCKQCSSA
jgi:stage IV sporulation protein A